MATGEGDPAAQQLQQVVVPVEGDGVPVGNTGADWKALQGPAGDEFTEHTTAAGHTGADVGHEGEVVVLEAGAEPALEVVPAADGGAAPRTLDERLALLAGEVAAVRADHPDDAAEADDFDAAEQRRSEHVPAHAAVEDADQRREDDAVEAEEELDRVDEAYGGPALTEEGERVAAADAATDPDGTLVRTDTTDGHDDTGALVVGSAAAAAAAVKTATEGDGEDKPRRESGDGHDDEVDSDVAGNRETDVVEENDGVGAGDGVADKDPANTEPATPAAPESHRRRNRILAAAAVVGVAAVGATLAWLWGKAGGDPNTVISMVPNVTPPPEVTPPVVVVPPVPPVEVVPAFSQAALTTASGEGLLHIVSEVGSNLSADQAQIVADQVAPALQKVPTATGEMFVYASDEVPGGVGVNESNGQTPVAALEIIRAKIAQLGWA